MADQPGFDFNKLAQQMGLGGGGGAQDPNAKPEDLSDFFNKLFEKLGDWVTKFSSVNVTSIFKTGITAHVDFQKAAIQTQKEINQSPLVKGSQGGVLANIVFGEVFKPSGAPTSSSASGGDSGGWGGGSGSDYASSGGGGSFADYSAIAAPSHSFDWSPVSMASLGEFSPPTFGGRSAAVSADMGIG